MLKSGNTIRIVPFITYLHNINICDTLCDVYTLVKPNQETILSPNRDRLTKKQKDSHTQRRTDLPQEKAHKIAGIQDSEIKLFLALCAIVVKFSWKKRRTE